MKGLKILGALLLAAMALMATVGVSSALATETALCRKNTTNNGLPVCEGEHRYKGGTTVHAELETGTKFTFQNSLGLIECTKSTLEVLTEEETAIPLGAPVNAFTFTGCKDPSGGAAEIEVVKNKEGTLDIEIIDLPAWTHNGTLTFTNTEIAVTVETVFGPIKCFYLPGHSGTLTGGAMATIDLNGSWPAPAGGGFCGKGAATVKGNYTVTKPEPLWVST